MGGLIEVCVGYCCGKGVYVVEISVTWVLLFRVARSVEKR